MDYLDYELHRNMKAHKVFERFLKKAFAPTTEVIVAHHIIFMEEGKAPIEIPSADSLLFCYELMQKVFGDKAHMIMQTLANRPPDERERVLEDFLQAADIPV